MKSEIFLQQVPAEDFYFDCQVRCVCMQDYISRTHLKLMKNTHRHQPSLQHRRTESNTHGPSAPTLSHYLVFLSGVAQ